MARPLRNCLENVTYHIMSRCIETRDLMNSDFIKEIMIEVLKLAEAKYKFKLISYVIMDNHFHFIIKTVPNEASISRIMQYIKARFAERYNKLMKRTGPVWNERFKDTIIEHSENPVVYLNWLLWYLAFNPVRKNIVADPRDYKYGSINAYLDNNYEPQVRITLHELFLNLGETVIERFKKFTYYEEAYRKRLAIIF